MIKQKFIFLGGIFDKADMIENIKKDSKGNIQYAADTFQKALLQGFYYYFDKESFEVINLPFIGGFPINYRKPIFTYYLNNNKVSINNLMYLKNISREKLAFNLLKKTILEHNCNNYTIFVYSLHSPFLNAVLKIKKIFPTKKIKVVSIVPDLPEYMNLGKSKNFIFKALKSIDTNNIYSKVSQIDCFVTLTEDIAKKLNAENYSIVEGIYKQDEIDNFKNNASKTNTILYTGTIDEKYGIMNLVRAFLKLSTNYKLVIYGEGDSREELTVLSEKNPSIEYRGLADRDLVVKEQKKAKFLINPRNPDEEYTKYSFPSKIMEYMASGTPVITSKLPGIPNEYFDYITVIDTSTEESFSNTLNAILNQDYYKFQKMGKSAKNFVMENKNPKVQVKKILEMLGFDF